jgi:predicted enzyme related to lactoylglutathione lyase
MPTIQKGATVLERDGYISGVPCWIDTAQADPDAAAAFYGGLFGWEFEDAMPPGSPGPYYIARLHGGDVAAVSGKPEGAPPEAAWSTYIWVDSADDAAARVRAAGGTVLMEPFDVTSAGRMAVFADPEGAEFRVWQAGDHKGARIVNEPGTLNFNSLNTRDMSGALAFYGAVFGWETLDLPSGHKMWTLPGYAEFLERRDPGLRERMAEVGALDGFADVVATVSPLSDDQVGVPPHWRVTFAVEDADATAKRADALGGQVIVPPLDAPWVRMTVITDPQGATFIASQFVPENKNLGAEAGSALAS